MSEINGDKVNPLKLTIIEEQVLDEVKDALLICETWLKRDAKFTHRKSSVNLGLAHVERALMRLDEARSKYHRVNVSLIPEIENEEIKSLSNLPA